MEGPHRGDRWASRPTSSGPTCASCGPRSSRTGRRPGTLTWTPVRAALDEHLAGTPQAGEALLLADRLHSLVDACEEQEDDERRHVVCAAVAYFLEVDDAWNDLSAGGLSDDHRVVRAAELAMGG